MRPLNPRYRVPSVIYASVFCALGLLPLSVAAMRVTPTVFDLGASGRDARKTVSVANNGGDTPLPVELTLTRVDLDPNGHQVAMSGNDDDVLIFPPQAVIPPGATQAFRVQWVGDPGLAESRSYLIMVKQVPVQVAPEPGKTHAAVQMVLNFSVFATVAPAVGTSAFKVRSVEVIPAAKTAKAAKATITTEGKIDRSDWPNIALVIENTGNLHNYLCNANLTLQAGSWTKTLSPQDVLDLSGIGLVLPHHTRRFKIPIADLPANPGAITATVDLGKRTGLPY